MKKQPAKKPENKQGTSKEAAAARKANFIEAYIANGGNATEAAISAGYSPKTAYSQGGRLLKDVEIKQQLSRRQGQLADKFKLTVEDVLRQLAQIVYADPRKCFGPDGCLLPVSEWPDEVAAMVASVEVDALYSGSGKEREQIGVTQKVKFWDKNSAIEKAMKHLGQFEKDNAQKNPFEAMSHDQLNRFIERKKAELERIGTVH